MYTPAFNRVDDESQLRAFVADVGAGWLVTNGHDAAPSATYLPVIWRGDTVIAHFAKANAHWREIADGTPARLIVTGPDAYISPSWYSAKAEHGRVVPTWNYGAVHLSGTARIHEDPDWLRMAVTELTDVHEAERPDPWQVTDAPDAYIDGQLRGIVGVELMVTRASRARPSSARTARGATGEAWSRGSVRAHGRTIGGSPSRWLPTSKLIERQLGWDRSL